MQRGMIAAVTFLSVATMAQQAEAGWSLRNSFGQSIYLIEPQVPTLVTASATAADGTTRTETRIVAGCNGGLCYDGNRRLPVNFEIMPYYNFGLITLDLAVIFNLESRTDMGFNFGFRPGVRIFPFMGLYIRAFLDLTAAQISNSQAVTGAVRASFEGNLGVGLGYQFKLGPWGVFAEAGLNPRLWGTGRFNMPIEFRLGIALEP